MGAYKIIAVSCKAKDLNNYLKIVSTAFKNGVLISEFMKDK